MKQEMVSWLRTTHWDVFGCLNFKRMPNEIQAQQVLAYFWNRMDRHYFGNASHRNLVLPTRIHMIQGGKLDDAIEQLQSLGLPKYKND